MEKLPFNLTDLVPHEAQFELPDGLPGKTLTLNRWSLRVRNWATNKYGAEKLGLIFQEQRIQEIAEMAWFMLKEKDQFANNQEQFLDAVVSVQDQVNLIKALLAAVGIGEPEIEKIKAAIAEAEAPPADGSNPNPNG